jgi:hypothetical protein
MLIVKRPIAGNHEMGSAGLIAVHTEFSQCAQAELCLLIPLKLQPAYIGCRTGPTYMLVIYIAN